MQKQVRLNGKYYGLVATAKLSTTPVVAIWSKVNPCVVQLSLILECIHE